MNSKHYIALALTLTFAISACSGMSRRVPMPTITSAELEAVAREDLPAPSIPTRYSTKQLGERIVRIGSRLARASGEKGLRIVLTDEIGFNAGALADRSQADIIVGPPLALSMNDAELAFVLAHEIAHLRMKHTDSIETQSALVGAAGLLGNVVAVGARIALASQGIDVGSGLARMAGSGLGKAAETATRGVILATGYDRDQEREADYFALRYMDAAGFDLNGARQALYKLRAQERKAGRKEASDLFSTHPNAAERIVRATKWAQDLRRPEKRQAGKTATGHSS